MAESFLVGGGGGGPEGRSPARAFSRNHRLRGSRVPHTLTGSALQGDGNGSTGVFFLDKNLLGTNTFPVPVTGEKGPVVQPWPCVGGWQGWTQAFQGQQAVRAGMEGSVLEGRGPI